LIAFTVREEQPNPGVYGVSENGLLIWIAFDSSDNIAYDFNTTTSNIFGAMYSSSAYIYFLQFYVGVIRINIESSEVQLIVTWEFFDMYCDAAQATLLVDEETLYILCTFQVLNIFTFGIQNSDSFPYVSGNWELNITIHSFSGADFGVDGESIWVLLANTTNAYIEMYQIMPNALTYSGSIVYPKLLPFANCLATLEMSHPAPSPHGEPLSLDIVIILACAVVEGVAGFIIYKSVGFCRRKREEKRENDLIIKSKVETEKDFGDNELTPLAKTTTYKYDE